MTLKSILAFFLVCFCAIAGTVAIAWDDLLNPSETRYRVYEKAGATYSRIIETNEKTVTLNLMAGPHSIIVRAVSPEGIESDDSNELNLLVPYAVSIKIVVAP